MRGLLIAAPASGCGKTTVTLGLIRALIKAGYRIASAKAGPDYIDPRFHLAAGSSTCFNLDPWAMREQTLMSLASLATDSGDLLIVEGMMGLFDGARDGTGSSADLAEMLDLPVILVIDAASQSHSVAAVARGFSSHRQGCKIAGIILNSVGSVAHEKMLRQALAPLEIPVIGALARDAEFALPHRHLGLVQAGEHDNLENFVASVATHIGETLDLGLLVKLAQPLKFGRLEMPNNFLPPLGQNIAIARDTAFEFTYPHFLQHWRDAGVGVSFFSPLANEAPASDCDAVFLPGGYPELHAGRLAANEIFLDGLRQAANSNVLIYGECGGYMVLGEVLTDAQGADHAMAGLLPVSTSFAERKLHLGYRRLTPCDPDTLWMQELSAHEFHYASITTHEKYGRLFEAVDATGNSLGAMGHRRGCVMGSFAHIIDYSPKASL